jgi:xanthine/CO dehydrogenase XdhC/CoxF family maturation factor
MKKRLESARIFARLAALRDAEIPAALATVVRVRGSAYRRAGAKLLVAADGSTVGNVSGGCLEADVREVALRVLETGRPELRAYCSGADEVAAWDLGVGCEGEVEVWTEPASGVLAEETDLISGEEPFAVCTLLAGAGEPGPPRRLLVTATDSAGGLGDAVLDAAAVGWARERMGEGDSGIHEIEGIPLFIDLYAAPPLLLLVGAGEDARPLARLAVEVGFRVAVVDRRPALLAPDRFPDGVRLVRCHPSGLGGQVKLDERCHAVVMTHHYEDDLEYLRTLVRAPLPYLGVLGPRQRTDRILRALGEDGPVDESRIYGPVGLDIGTEGAEQVALSILSEILAVRSGRAAGSLRERVRPIHAFAL